MIVLAISGTLAAILWSLTVLGGNSMRSSPGDFIGGGSLLAAWSGAVILWLAWWFS